MSDEDDELDVRGWTIRGRRHSREASAADSPPAQVCGSCGLFSSETRTSECVRGGLCGHRLSLPTTALGHDGAVLDLALRREQDEAVEVGVRAEHEHLVGVEGADDLTAHELVRPRARDGDRALALPAAAEVDREEERRRARSRVVVGSDDPADDQLELLEILGRTHARRLTEIGGRRMI
jgi:hypothetical protein